MQEERREVSLKTAKPSLAPFFITAGGVVFLDQVSKAIVVNFLKINQSVPILPGIFHLTYILNPGASFGLFPGLSLLFVIAALIFIVIAIVFIFLERPRLVTQIFLGLISGGALGNGIDRLIYGAVVDWLDFRVWPVFNLADVAISLGVFLFIYKLISKRR